MGLFDEIRCDFDLSDRGEPEIALNGAKLQISGTGPNRH